MTLLTAVTNVANECGYSIDTVAYASTDVTTKQLVAMAQRIADKMFRYHPWTKLRSAGTITLATSTASYALPSDFSYYHRDTFWNSSTNWRVLGPMTPQEYAEIVGSGRDLVSYQRFQLRGMANKRLYISPTPTSSDNGDTVIFEYIAARPIRPRTWTASLAVTSGSYIFYNGNYYTAGSSATTGATPPTHTSGSASDGVVTWTYYSGAYDRFLADTDEMVLSQSTLELGMLERFGGFKQLSVGALFDGQLAEDAGIDSPGQTYYCGDDGPANFITAQNGRVSFGG